jgi:hypothetical protein
MISRVSKHSAVGWLIFGLTIKHAAFAAETLKLEVGETAGIKRFGYPIALKLPELAAGKTDIRFRLRDGDKPVAAQFRQEPGEDGDGRWWLDFNLSLVPHEVRELILDYGPDVPAAPEPRGLQLSQTPDGFEIRNGTNLTWLMGDDVSALLKSVDAAGLQHLRPPGVRLGMEGPNGEHIEMTEASSPPRIVRSGPLAVAIRCSLKSASAPFAEVTSTIDLTFPVSKSWLQVDWRIDDPRKTVRAVEALIAQNLTAPTEKEPTLIDFGASSLVYMSLTPGTVGRLQASSAASDAQSLAKQEWSVFRGARDRPELFVSRPSLPNSSDAEGWAHIMDRQRCMALAVGQFGQAGDDTIEVTAEGDVRIIRQFASNDIDRPTRKSIQFWLHFVGFPPHVTAATSPQSMLSPLTVTVQKR